MQTRSFATLALAIAATDQTVTALKLDAALYEQLYYSQTQTTHHLIDTDRLPLSTKGAEIVDKHGTPVRLACVNWYGAHMEQYANNGLDLLPID